MIVQKAHDAAFIEQACLMDGFDDVGRQWPDETIRQEHLRKAT